MAKTLNNSFETWCKHNIRNDLLLEWDYDRNLPLKPDQISAGSERKVFWKCKNGHEWSSRINSRTRGKGCPYCSGRMAIKGVNDLATTYPLLIKEWDYEKNKPLTPEQVSAGSHKKVWWRCSMDHSYEMTIYKRTKEGCGCYYCCVPAKRVLKGFNDLETKFPELAKEWHPYKNGDLTPDKILCASHKKVWWRCKAGHEWEAIISSRTRIKANGCPYCSGERVLLGFNDLSTVNPELAKEWDYEKNKTLKPTDVTLSSGRKVWWKCEKGHSWSAIIANRSKGSGCRVCQKEKQTSFPEQAIFYYVHRIFLDAENGNTTVLDGKELDVYIPSKRIGIEFDGSTWHQDKQRDEEKNALCEKKGIVLYRIRDRECPKLNDNPFVYEIELYAYNDESIEKAIKELLTLLNSDFDVNLSRDKSEIIIQYIAKKKDSSVATTDFVNEWNYERNGNITPDLFYSHSKLKCWWKCARGHEWQASPDNRSKGKKCPYCSGRRAISGENDLATLRPDLIEEWDFDKNTTISPSEVKSVSGLYAWWKCKKCAYEWHAKISNRSNGTGCPRCSRKKRNN